MKYTILLLCLLCTIVCSTYKSEAEVIQVETPIVETVDTSKMTIPEMIEYLAPQYNQNVNMMKEIIFCESSNRTDVPHDGGLGKGVTGYHKSTFLEHEETFGMDLNYESSFDQIKLMMIAFQSGERKRNLWSSYKRYAKYGTCDISKIRKMNI